MTGGCQSVLAVVVTYHPIGEYLLPLLEQLCIQCQEVLVVDNTPAADDSLYEQIEPMLLRVANVRVVRIGRNAGIGAALNLGFTSALAEDFDYVLCSDQDSMPTTGMVNNLVAAAQAMNSRGKAVGAVGPLIHDLVTSMKYPFQAPIPGKLFYGHQYPTVAEPHVVSSSIISSGMLIPIAVAKEVGGMAEALFIDYVDIEWCHRAIARGYEIIGTGSAILNHRLGERELRVWYFGWRTLSEYGSVRLYYRFRNFIHLWRLSYISRAWKLRSVWYLMGIAYGHIVYSQQRHSNLRAIVGGIWDGLIGRTGQCVRSRW